MEGVEALHVAVAAEDVGELHARVELAQVGRAAVDGDQQPQQRFEFAQRHRVGIDKAHLLAELIQSLGADVSREQTHRVVERRRVEAAGALGVKEAPEPADGALVALHEEGVHGGARLGLGEARADEALGDGAGARELGGREVDGDRRVDELDLVHGVDDALRRRVEHLGDRALEVLRNRLGRAAVRQRRQQLGKLGEADALHARPHPDRAIVVGGRATVAVARQLVELLVEERSDFVAEDFFQAVLHLVARQLADVPPVEEPPYLADVLPARREVERA